MASRVAGAVLALTAAALLAVSVIAGAWWSGHPTFNGAEIKAKEITVGPLGATGCNTGGDGACMKLSVDPTFETIGFALAGVTGLLALTALVLAVMTARGAARRKSFAIFVIVGAMVSAGLALVLVVVGPKIRTEAPLPFSTGLFVFFGGVASALASSVFAMRNPPPTRVQLAPARQSLQPLPHAPMSPGFDVQALLAEDALRPSSLGPEPMMGRGSPVQSPGGALPGPSGPLGAIGASGPQPLFTSAPNLRPLYDVAPGQGGTGGFVPAPPTHIPMRAPTPFSRDQIAAVTGVPTPPPLHPVTVAGVSAPPPSSDATDRDLLGIAKPKTLPPPNRGKTSSIAPIPPLVQPRPMPTLATAAVPPPPNLPRLESEDGSFDAMKTYQREPSPPMPEPPSFDAMKTYEREPSPPKPEPPKPAPKVKDPPRAPTPRPPTRLLTEDAAVDTDVRTQAIDDGPPTETFETATNESTAFAPKPRAPSISSTMETQAAPPDDDDDDEQMTAAREKVARTDMELPTVRPPTDTSPSPIVRPPTDTSPSPIVRPPTDTSPSPTVRPPTDTSPSPTVRPPTDHEPAPLPPANTPAVDEAPTDHEPAKERAATKLPISTAPESLPPPTEKQAAASGPSPACPQCEAPMAWVEAHLRFYCKSCKMYF